MKFLYKNFYSLLLALAILCIIIPIMLTLWGSLPKAQDDPQLITEAITAAIAAHESDPTAHLGDGESLEQHKSNEVIDHPAQSLVPDKFNSSNKFSLIPVNNLTDVHLENESDFIPGFIAQLWSSSPITGTSFARLLEFNLSNLGSVSNDFIINFLFSAYDTTGTWQGSFNALFARVDIKQGYYRLGYFDGSWHYTSWVSYTLAFAQRWRIFYEASSNTIFFYLNSVEVYSVVQTPTFDSSDYMIEISLSRGTSSPAFVIFGDISVGISV